MSENACDRSVFAPKMFHMVAYIVARVKRLWSKEDALWITAMNQLFDSMYGKDALKYLYSKDKGTTIQEFDDPRNLSQYDHNICEVNYETSCVTATNNDGSSKVAKSLKPQLDMSCQQSEEPPSSLDPKPDKNPPAVSVSKQVIPAS